MAKVLNPLWSRGARGTIGDTITFRQSRQTYYAQARPVPPKHITPKRAETREFFRWAQRLADAVRIHGFGLANAAPKYQRSFEEVWYNQYGRSGFYTISPDTDGVTIPGGFNRFTFPPRRYRLGIGVRHTKPVTFKTWLISLFLKRNSQNTGQRWIEQFVPQPERAESWLILHGESVLRPFDFPIPVSLPFATMVVNSLFFVRQMRFVYFGPRAFQTTMEFSQIREYPRISPLPMTRFERLADAATALPVRSRSRGR